MTDDATGWALQIRSWGWAILSSEPDPRDALRNPATILEARDKFETGGHVWDRKPDGERWIGNRQVPIPDWWGLAYIPSDIAYEIIAAEHWRLDAMYPPPCRGGCTCAPGEAIGYSRDEGDGMLLSDLLDQSTLDYVAKVKARPK